MVSEAKAARAQARAACLNADVAQREANRIVNLRKTEATSEEKADKAVTKAKALKAECEAAKASALMSKAKVGVAQAALDRTRLMAPFNGVIAEINGELSEYVTPSPVGIAIPPVVDLIDNTCFYVTAPIDEVDVPNIEPGMNSRVSLDVFGDRRFTGKVPRMARAFAVLGSTVKDELLGSTNPLGRRIRIGGERYRVIGIMESKGQMLGFDLDDGCNSRLLVYDSHSFLITGI